MVNVAGAQEVVLSTSGRPGRSRNGRRLLNVMPREGGNNFSGSFVVNGANGAMQGSNYTQALQGPGPDGAVRAHEVFDVNPMGGGRIIRDKLWFYLTYREMGGRQHGPGHVHQQERRQPECLDRGFRHEPPGVCRRQDRNGIARLTWQATPRNKINVHWSEQYNTATRKAAARRR